MLVNEQQQQKKSWLNKIIICKTFWDIDLPDL